jgi:hypothetical protein
VPSPTATIIPAPTQVLPVACNNPDSRIDVVAVGSQRIIDFKTIPTINGSTFFHVNADAPNFKEWKLEYSGDGGKNWVTFYGPNKYATPFSRGGSSIPWNTTTVPDGIYLVRSVIVNNDGNFNDPCQFQVLVKNAGVALNSVSSMFSCQDSNVTLTSPTKDLTVPIPNVVFNGTVKRDNFSYYAIQYSTDQQNWKEITRVSEQRTDAYLGSWNVSSIADGDYWVRVLAVDKTANYQANPCQVHIVIKHMPTPTTLCGPEQARITILYTNGPNNTLASFTDFSKPIAVSSQLFVHGIVNLPNFQYYFLQYSLDRKNWTDSLRMTSQHETDDFLGYVFNTTMPNGDYWIRLHVVDRSANYKDSCEIQVSVKN